MSAPESAEAALGRWALLYELQKHYADFTTFLRDGMELLGFSASDIQEDIGHYMVHGPDSLMVQAQRGQAKTTVAALFSVWSLIHAPHFRILVVSAGGTQANEISTLIVRIIMNMDVLECMRPDAQAGDRTSVEHFDIHHSLKGLDKSPSVACVGITANLQGKRADILIADDIESSKNALTQTQRAQLAHLTLDFVSICMGSNGKPGRIIWLGTPQTTDSIYNALPGRGVSIRIWPGRYPTADELSAYGPYLAPLILRRLESNPSLRTGGGLMGDKGQPVDPSYLGESVLQRKVMDQGEAYFQLQHMLNTRLMDAERYPLKLERCVVLRLSKNRRVPTEVVPGMSKSDLRPFSHGGKFAFNLASMAAALQTSYAPVPTLHMYIDPAGGGINADESAYAVSGVMNGNVFIFAAGGVKGGYNREQLDKLIDVAVEWDVNIITIEKNMGYGAFREVMLPLLHQRHPKCALEDDLVTGQKELRIANTLEPVIGRGSLVFNEDIIENDWILASRYGERNALSYSLFFQMSKLTRDRGALQHDDRVDALEGTVRFWQKSLGLDQEAAKKKAEALAYAALTRDPLGYNRYKKPEPARTSVRVRLGRHR